MSGRAVVAAYARTGGRPPSDDERLEILDDGSWRLWRTLGGPRVGAFGGRLSADRRRRLGAAIAAARGAGKEPPPSGPRPDSAHEAFVTGPARLDVASGTKIIGAWSGLARLLRRWTVAFTDEPRAALALEAGPGGGPPRLVHLGPEATNLWPATIHVDLYARDTDGIIRDRASGGMDPEDRPGRGEPVTTGAGWAMELPVGRAPGAPPGGVLETWVLLDLDGPEGPVRTRLTLAVPRAG